MNMETINPAYVQVTKQEAAKILGRSVAEFDRLRVSDRECPEGFTNGKSRNSRVMFRLSDIYTYSAHLMATAQPVRVYKEA